MTTTSHHRQTIDPITLAHHVQEMLPQLQQTTPEVRKFIKLILDQLDLPLDSERMFDFKNPGALREEIVREVENLQSRWHSNGQVIQAILPRVIPHGEIEEIEVTLYIPVDTWEKNQGEELMEALLELETPTVMLTPLIHPYRAQ